MRQAWRLVPTRAVPLPRPLIALLMSLLLLLPGAPADESTPPSDEACSGKRLYNGICIPHRWPPLWRRNGSSVEGVFPPRDGAYTAPYLRSPPAVVDVSVGRQLFVDPFLVESMPGLQLLSHAATWHGQVLNATEEWEAWSPSIPKQPYPQGPLATGLAYPFSGGLWWDEERLLYRVWYMCGSEVATVRVGCCYAESPDGIIWEKKKVGTGSVNGTNIVHEELFNGHVVWQDHDTANATERWKMVTVLHLLNVPICTQILFL